MCERLCTHANAARILRIGLGIELLVFGAGKLIDADTWMGYIPPWFSPFLPVSASSFLAMIGVIEVVLGLCIVFGWWLRTAAAVAALHLVGVLVILGYPFQNILRNDLFIRDVVSLAVALAIACSPLPSTTPNASPPHDHSGA